MISSGTGSQEVFAAARLLLGTSTTTNPVTTTSPSGGSSTMGGDSTGSQSASTGSSNNPPKTPIAVPSPQKPNASMRTTRITFAANHRTTKFGHPLRFTATVTNTSHSAAFPREPSCSWTSHAASNRPPATRPC